MEEGPGYVSRGFVIGNGFFLGLAGTGAAFSSPSRVVMYRVPTVRGTEPKSDRGVRDRRGELKALGITVCSFVFVGC